VIALVAALWLLLAVAGWLFVRHAQREDRGR